jgi:hypothetical protein
LIEESIKDVLVLKIARNRTLEYVVPRSEIAYAGVV